VVGDDVDNILVGDRDGLILGTRVGSTGIEVGLGEGIRDGLVVGNGVVGSTLGLEVG
jgi:hypothetical protein